MAKTNLTDLRNPARKQTPMKCGVVVIGAASLWRNRPLYDVSVWNAQWLLSGNGQRFHLCNELCSSFNG
jgi:hypothetical protein